MSKLSDELLEQVINTETEFMRRYREKFHEETEMDIYIIAFLKELQECRKRDAAIEDIRDDFGNVVYEELEEDETNGRANRIIDAFDDAIGRLLVGTSDDDCCNE